MELATLLGNLSMGLPFVLSGMKSRVVGVLFCKDLNMLLFSGMQKGSRFSLLITLMQRS